MWLNQFKRKKVVFLHIPKTGGMTFQNILRQVFPHSVHFVKNPDIEKIRKNLKSYRCIVLHGTEYKGEFIYLTQDIMQPAYRHILKDASIFVLFRNPVKQHLSLFSFLKRKRDEILPIYQQNDRTFPETLEDFLTLVHYNQQLGFLVGNLQSNSATVVNKHDLEYAKSLLINLDIKVGITERYADFLHIFETVTGKRIPDRTIKIINQNPNQSIYEAVDEETLNIIRQRNHLDMELYEFARGLFEKQLATCGPRPEYRFR